ncbi:hypothetical protein ABT039_17840 [Streptomyces lasiicapitis]|uniref:hypothetical protein n=1 Tax=Streptomyces lasiicapitis TaxID=1923961 RepID=UPI00331B9023
MTRYGFAIKALPKGDKPVGDDDEDQDRNAADVESTETDAAPEAAEPNATPLTPGGKATDHELAADEDLTEREVPDGANPTAPAALPEDDVAPDPGPSQEDDARPWSGDMYDEGDESDPSTAFAAYKGAEGEEAWLDQAPDGTLTGWVRDATGQVWRYTDPDVWAIDVDDAQMTRTHSQASGGGAAETEHGGQDSLFPSKQS